MFEDRLEEMTAAGTAAAFSSRVSEQHRAECDQLELAAHWADLKAPEGLPKAGRTPVALVGERAIRPGGSGTPEVAEFAAAELAIESGSSQPQASSILADALDLRHRFPNLWMRVRAARVRAWVARKIACRTRHLSLRQCWKIDGRICDELDGISGSRLEQKISAEILRVDTERMEQLAEEAKRARFVAFGQSDDDGICSIFARVDAASGVRFKATLMRLADILMSATEPIPGVPDRDAHTRDEWEAVALDVMGIPGLAFRILTEQAQPELFDDYIEASTAASTEVQAATAEATPTVGQDATPADQAGEPPSEEPPPDDLDRDDPAAVTAERRERALQALVRAIDPTVFLPRVVLYVHISDQALAPADGPAETPIARIEEIGPALLQQVREWLGSGSAVQLRPAIHSGDTAAVDQYEVSGQLREELFLRTPASCFPYSSRLSRTQDIDHTLAYVQGGSAQTRLGNLGPLSRAEHRFKTFGRVTVRQPEPGTYVWRTRYGSTVITNPAGTHNLGIGDFADTVWRAAQQAGLDAAA